jgi:hypothetical protein
MSEQMPQRRSGRSSGLVEIDDAFLDGNEDRELREELRHRRPAELDVAATGRAELAAGREDDDGGGARRPVRDLSQRLHRRRY